MRPHRRTVRWLTTLLSLSLFTMLLGANLAPASHAANDVFAVTADPVNATPVLNNGDRVTRDRAALHFTALDGDPTEMRYRWGSPPTETDPWQPLPLEAAPLALSLPAAPPDHDGSCRPLTLYTQVRRGETVQETPAQTTLLVDTAVQTRVFPVVYAIIPPAPGWNIDPWFSFFIAQGGECSGAEGFTVDVGDGPEAIYRFPHVATRYLLDAPEGVMTATLTVTDRLGNTQDYTFSQIYDKTPPTADYEAAELAVRADDPSNTLAHTLTISNARYQDEAYPAMLPYGALVYATTTPYDPAANVPWQFYRLNPDATAWGDPREADGPPTVSAEVTISLARHMPFPFQPGIYHYALIFVDHAGNPTSGMGRVEGQFTLDTVTHPILYLPLVGK
ncbi:MAG: hypothetical protein AB4911_02170 [Oscillochloridaceae bacterium umkhey_bin13]